MEVTGIPTFGSVSGGAGVPDEELGQEAFLRLLTTQLQHQDPLSPASDVEFIEQLTQFSSLEQLRNTNKNLNLIQVYQHSLNNSNSLNIVGKDVKIQSTRVHHEGEGQEHTFYYDGAGAASKVHIAILDSEGNEVFNQDLTGSSNGEQTFLWHGQDNEGNQVEGGEYFLKVTLEDAEGVNYPTPTYQNVHVDGLSYENGSIYLIVNGEKMPVEDVVEVFEASGGDSPTDAPTETAVKTAKNSGILLPFLNNRRY